MSSTAHLVKSGFFAPVLAALEGAGVNTGRYLRQASLDRFDLGNIENYVPVGYTYALLDDICRSQGIDDFYAVFGAQINLQSLCAWGETISFARDVLSACQLAIRNENVIQTHEKMHLQINGTRSIFSLYFLDTPAPGRNYAEYINLAYALTGFRLAGGADWAPMEIHLQSDLAPDFEHLLPANCSTRVYPGQPKTAIVFSTEMLSAPMLHDGDTMVASALEPPPLNLVQAVEALLTSSKAERLPNMEATANMLNMAPRTLRRQLAEHATTFSEITDNWRLKEALALLKRGDLRIDKIGKRLGYANTPNFVRAFKRQTGCSPGAYQDT